ncbi:MAG: HAMP domain-containing protein [Phycisphaerales bacterium]
MLRRKFLARIGLLIGAFVAGAVVAIYLLQAVLADIDRVNGDAAVLIGGIQDVSGAVNGVEVARLGDGNAPALAAHSARLREALARLGEHAATAPGGAAAGSYGAARGLAPGFLAEGTAERTVAMHTAVQELGREVRGHVASEQAALGRHFRGLVLGLTLAALLMVNVAVCVLLRTAQMVLRPVGALVEGSRELAHENFAHRVRVSQDDEFGELAHAYNRLAEELGASEGRKAEALRQLAVTLNHDLNNALSAVQLQLELAGRQSGGNAEVAGRLREVRSVLGRMSGTVASLKNIRRVVLTDYAPGQKMLDLERSIDGGAAPAIN